MPLSDSTHPALPEGLTGEQIPPEWELIEDGRETRAYINGEANLLVYVYSDGGMERPLGVNLERTPEHHLYDYDPQVAATTVSDSKKTGYSEPAGSLWAVVKGYMELAEVLDDG